MIGHDYSNQPLKGLCFGTLGNRVKGKLGSDQNGSIISMGFTAAQEPVGVIGK